MPLQQTRPRPQHSARKAGLRYVSDDIPGIRRLRSGAGFRYLDAEGRTLRDRRTLARIRSLVIPPAWTEVWICPSASGHLQATGRDARGRKQHRYHPGWRDVRDATKYDRLLDFAGALPKIRRRVAADLRRDGLGRDRVLATLVRLMDLTFLRVGNEQYAKQNGSYGLTTLRDRHAKIRGGTIRFRFRGKSGKEHEIELNDRRLAAIVRGCQDIPGQVLFQYWDDDGRHREVTSRDVNDYLRDATGADFTARDFRTWAGSVLAMRALQGLAAEDGRDAKKNVLRAVEHVASELGNTVAVCRKCYIHPSVLEHYTSGVLPPTKVRARGNGVGPSRAGARSAAARGASTAPSRARRSTSLDPDEKELLRFLRCCRRRKRPALKA